MAISIDFEHKNSTEKANKKHYVLVGIVDLLCVCCIIL